MLTENELQAIRERCDSDIKLGRSASFYYTTHIPQLLDHITALQSKLADFDRTPSIVYCKDCHYAKDDTEFCQKHHYVYCTQSDDNTCRNYNDFCSYGKQKEGNT